MSLFKNIKKYIVIFLNSSVHLETDTMKIEDTEQFHPIENELYPVHACIGASL